MSKPSRSSARAAPTPNGCAASCREKARAEAEGIIKNAERQIQLETARALEQIRHEAADLSVAIASKLIQKNITKEDNERLIDDALKQLQ